MAVQRKDIPKKDQWNVDALYPSLKAWEKDLQRVVKKKQAPFFPEIAKCKGNVTKNSSSLKKALQLYFQTERELRKLYTYAHLRHDEDITNDSFKNAYDTISQIYHQFAQEASFLEPEILAVDEKKLKTLLKDKALSEYVFFLEKLVRMKPYVLD